MSLLSPSRSHSTLAIFLWLSMLFLICQHYHGLSQIPGRPVDKGITLIGSQLKTSSSDVGPDEKQPPGTPPANAPIQPNSPPAPATAYAIDALISSIEKTSLFFINESPQPSEFFKMGGRLQILETWLSARSTLHPQMTRPQLQSLDNHIERTIMTLFPFIRHPAQPKNAQPFTTLRQTFLPSSQGIIMIGSKTTLHSLAHTILNIRIALKSSLPIQIFHAGESDFPPSARRFIKRLSHNITTSDVKTLISDSTIALKAGGPPSLRPFSALASTFSQLLLVQPGTTFLQPPETLFTTAYPSFPSKVGALFFHSHLFGKGDNHDAHSFWQSHLKNHPHSPALRSSRTYNERYAEEADASVVVLDKRRLSTLTGLLHTCWQNTEKVRAESPYTYAPPDERDTWWFGFELAAAAYSWGGGYGGTLGWPRNLASSSSSSSSSGSEAKVEKERICGNTSLHVDHHGKPLWFSGGLLQSYEDKPYAMPAKWMVEGVWQAAREGHEMDCMWGGESEEISGEEKRVLEASMKEAKEVDEIVRRVLDGEKNRG